MQSYQRRNLLSAALQLQPGRDPTRETVEAAIWQALGPLGDESRVSLLLSVIDAWSDARSRRAAVTWARRTGGELPPLGTDIAQGVAVRRALDNLCQLPRTAVIRVPREVPAAAVATASSPEPEQPRPYLSVISTDGILNEPAAVVSITDAVWAEMRAEFAPEAALELAPVPEPPAGDLVISEELFTCSGCPKLKPRTGFYKSSSNKRGFDYLCKECKGKKNKAWRDRKKQEQEQEAAPQPAASVASAEENAGDAQAEDLIDYLLSS